MAIFDIRNDPEKIGEEIFKGRKVADSGGRLKGIFTSLTGKNFSPEKLLKEIDQSFLIDDGEVNALSNIGSRTGQFEVAMEANELKKLNPTEVKRLGKEYKAQLKDIEKMEKKIADARSAILNTIRAPMDEANTYAGLLKEDLAKVAEAAKAGRMPTLAAPTLAYKNPFEIAGSELFLRHHEGDIKIGEMVTPSGGGTPKFEFVGNGWDEAKSAVNEYGTEARRAAQEVRKEIEENFGNITSKLGEYKSQAEQVASKIPGIAESAAKTVAQDVKEGVIATASKDAKGLGYTEKVMANIRGTGWQKGRAFLGALGLAGLGYCSVKNLTSGGKDEDGKPVEGRFTKGVVQGLGAIGGAVLMGSGHGRAR